MQCDKKLFLYDYPLPREYIAQHPLPRREASRLMVLHRTAGKLEHRHFWNLPEYLREGDSIVLNNSKVLPARLVGKRSTGGRVKLLLIEEMATSQASTDSYASGGNSHSSGRWRALLEARGKLREGEELDLEEGKFRGRLISRVSSNADGISVRDYDATINTFSATARQWVIQLEPRCQDYSIENFLEVLERVGRMPLPPYIKRPLESDPYLLQDRERYQSVVATQLGSIAAPTASLHFTNELLQEISKKGVEIIFITLHVGLGTFTPIKTSNISQHTMEREYYELGREAVQKLNETKRRGGRIIAVGSTSLRVLETAAAQAVAPKSSVAPQATVELSPSEGWTNLFIHPPYEFKIVDALLTNFHLPRSTPLVLVSAFAGRERILNAYSIAKKEGYRFYSYGDAMLIL